MDKKKPTQEELDFHLDDRTYLPLSYLKFEVSEPIFKGKGEHYVKELEQICEQYKEYCHQQRVIKQHLKQHLIESKFDIHFGIVD